ncbi:MAG: bifunctional 5,10-methylenetetrahydrofolate dehydrogenase/5,10-methenyltetrahydrofolate cyclohydrolase [Chloroflexi bacterium]|nr:bifunctional 5,10-methylenetetrahydrofolate dehydrogenase/5,10-methenyltetrahydrofolate cyclohydrolase [Chloroflexota bacterium]
MSARLLEGRPVAARLWERAAAEAARLRDRLGQPPTLAIVQVGQDPSAAAYTRQILRSFARYGLEARLEPFPSEVAASDLYARVEALGRDSSVQAVLVQTPLPAPLTLAEVVRHLPPEKDAEGVHPTNAGLLWQGTPRVVPSTPAAGMELLREAGVAPQGRLAVVVGRSNTVGKPLAQLLLAQHATVVVAHSRTRDLAALTRQAEILAVAIGRPGAIKGDMVAPGAVVLDFGTTEVEGRLAGDVDFEPAQHVAAAITPVPGGIGPVTIAMLALNVLALAGGLEAGG